MAKDPTPSQIATNSLQSFPFDNIIGGPLKTCIEAQAMESQKSRQFIEETGLHNKEIKGKE